MIAPCSLARRFSWLALALALALGSLVAAPALIFSAMAAPVVVATGDEYPPYADARMSGGGLAIELVRTVFADMGETLKIDVLPWARQFEESKQGLILATFPWADKDNRRDFFLFSDPLFDVKELIWTLPGSPLMARKADDLIGTRLCLPLGYGRPTDLIPLIDAGQIALEVPPDMEICFKLLQAGRLDGVIAIEGQAEVAALDVFGRKDRVRMVDFGAPRIQLHVLFSKKSPEAAAWMTRFNASLARVKAN